MLYTNVFNNEVLEKQDRRLPVTGCIISWQTQQQERRAALTFEGKLRK